MSQFFVLFLGFTGVAAGDVAAAKWNQLDSHSVATRVATIHCCRRAEPFHPSLSSSSLSPPSSRHCHRHNDHSRCCRIRFLRRRRHSSFVLSSLSSLLFVRRRQRRLVVCRRRRSFVCSFVRLFVRLFVVVRSSSPFVRSSLSFRSSFVRRRRRCSFVRSFVVTVRSFVRSFVRSSSSSSSSSSSLWPSHRQKSHEVIVTTTQQPRLRSQATSHFTLHNRFPIAFCK